jgi:hypothetical protein
MRKACALLLRFGSQMNHFRYKRFTVTFAILMRWERETLSVISNTGRARAFRNGR